jgi:hypothetical protein
MTTFGLRQAAIQAGTSKSTILRAIQAGRLSAARTDDGGYAIDPAELFRVYPPKPSTDADQSDESSEGHDAPPADAFDATELRIRNAQLESEIKALRTILDVEKERCERERQRSEEIKAERDRWAAQAERLALAPPQPTPAPVHPQPRGWWPFRRSA